MVVVANGLLDLPSYTAPTRPPFSFLNSQEAPKGGAGCCWHVAQHAKMEIKMTGRSPHKRPHFYSEFNFFFPKITYRQPNVHFIFHFPCRSSGIVKFQGIQRDAD